LQQQQQHLWFDPLAELLCWKEEKKKPKECDSTVAALLQLVACPTTWVRNSSSSCMSNRKALKQLRRQQHRYSTHN
jgi:hypothetical protein